MPVLTIDGFDGLSPRTSPTALAPNQAQQADNVKLYAQELRYWRAPVLDTIPVLSNIGTIYRMVSGASSQWLTWQADVDPVPGPVADLTDVRLYYTGDGVPKKTNWAMATTSAPYPTAWLNMGVPAPTAAPAVAATGGTGTAEDRVYVYTYVSTFGTLQEESAPSPASSLVTVLPGGTVTVNGFTAPPSTNYNVTSRRIYRSVAGASTASYLFVAEIPLSTSSYADTLTVAQLGAAISTIGLIPPPAALQGLVSLPSGCLAGFVGNTVYFSELYKPHAWPLAYALSVPHNIVGLAVYGNSVVVCTDRVPFIMSGTYPGAMSVTRIPLIEPCVSKRSIVSDQYGVTYASPNGLVNISDQIREVITSKLFRRDEWQALGPANIRAKIYDGKYIGSFTTGGNSLVISRDDVPALSYVTLSPAAQFIDSTTAALYFVDSRDNKIYQMDGATGASLTYNWLSKRFTMQQGTSFSCLRVDADYSQIVQPNTAQATANATAFAGNIKGSLNSVALDTLAVNGSVIVAPSAGSFVQVQIYGDGVLQCTLTPTSWGIIRIPPFRCREIALRLVGTINVRSIQLATNPGLLRAQTYGDKMAEPV